jgi:hypothetical protein
MKINKENMNKKKNKSLNIKIINNNESTINFENDLTYEYLIDKVVDSYDVNYKVTNDVEPLKSKKNKITYEKTKETNKKNIFIWFIYLIIIIIIIWYGLWIMNNNVPNKEFGMYQNKMNGTNFLF